MTEYKCFNCYKMVADSYVRKNVRCPYCGAKVLYKQRSVSKKIKAI